MAGKGEGIYASSKSVDVGTHQTDHGLTLHPKTQSRDATHPKNAHPIIGGGLKDAFLPLHSIGLQSDTDPSWSNPIVINAKSQPNDPYPAKRRRLATDASSYTSQGDRSGSETGTRSVSTSNLTLQESAKQPPQHSWSTLSLEPGSDTVDWKCLTGEENIPPDPPLAPHVSARPCHGHSYAHQEVSHHYGLLGDGVSRPVMEIDIKKETSPTEYQIPIDGRAVCASSVSEHVVFMGNMQNLVDTYQTTRHAAGNVDPKQGKTHPFEFGARSGVSSWGPYVPIPSVEKDFQELEVDASNEKSMKRSLPSRCSRAAAVAYGVSNGLFGGHSRDSKLGPFWSASQTLRNSSTQRDSSQIPTAVSQPPPTAIRDLKFQQSSTVTTNKNPSQDHVIPANLRIQLDALVKKYHQDALFRQSVDTYIMEMLRKSELLHYSLLMINNLLLGLPQSSDNGAVEMMEEPVPDPLDGKSLAEIKSMYKTLEGRFERLRLVTKGMSEDRLQDRSEIEYLKTVAKKIPVNSGGGAKVAVKAKKPSDEMWVCQLPAKGGKRCGRRNFFYKQAVIWMKKKTCSGCKGYINNIRDGFKYSQLADIIDSCGMSLVGDDDNEDGSHPSPTPQQGAPDNTTFASPIENHGTVDPSRIGQKKAPNVAHYAVNAHLGYANNGENYSPQLADQLVTNEPSSSYANLPPQGDPFIDTNTGSRNLSGDNYELIDPALRNMAFQQPGLGGISLAIQSTRTVKRTATPTQNRITSPGSSLRHYATPTKLGIGNIRLESPHTLISASSRQPSETPISASRDGTHGHTRPGFLPRKERPSLDPKLLRTYDGRQWPRYEAPLNPLAGQADKSTTPSGVGLRDHITAKNPVGASRVIATSEKIPPKNFVRNNVVLEKIVPETAPAKRKASENAPSKKPSPKKRLTEAQRRMIESTNGVSEHFSGRTRKAWEGPAKHAKPKKVIEISTDSESDSRDDGLSDMDSLFGPGEEHEATEVATVEHVDSNIMDSEEGLGDLEDALRAALESDELMESQEEQTNGFSSPIQKMMATAAEESDESEEE
jgi:hypothetical protein